jgi:hypothetical protein
MMPCSCGTSFHNGANWVDVFVQRSKSSSGVTLSVVKLAGKATTSSLFLIPAGENHL